jgi:protein SCO1/2
VSGLALRRGLLWGLLVAAILAVTAATVVQRLRRPEQPPVLGRVPDFTLVNRDGRPVGLRDLAGAPWVADFIFTRCPASCPMLTARMARLNRDLPADLGVRLVSFSVDPEHDTPAVLEKYAASFDAPGRWLFLTGSREKILSLSRDGFKLGLELTPPPGIDAPEPILHTTRFVLVDGHGGIRGYYEAFEEESMEKLLRDLGALSR